MSGSYGAVSNATGSAGSRVPSLELTPQPEWMQKIFARMFYSLVVPFVGFAVGEVLQWKGGQEVKGYDPGPQISAFTACVIGALGIVLIGCCDKPQQPTNKSEEEAAPILQATHDVEFEGATLLQAASTKKCVQWSNKETCQVGFCAIMSIAFGLYAAAVFMAENSSNSASSDVPDNITAANTSATGSPASSNASEGMKIAWEVFGAVIAFSIPDFNFMTQMVLFPKYKKIPFDKRPYRAGMVDVICHVVGACGSAGFAAINLKARESVKAGGYTDIGLIICITSSLYFGVVGVISAILKTYHLRLLSASPSEPADYSANTQREIKIFA